MKAKTPPPYPELAHWMAKRIDIHEIPPSILEKIRNQEKYQKFNYIVSSLMRITRFTTPGFRWVGFKLFTKIVYAYFKLFNRIRVFGRENIPDKAIFYANHPGSLDPLILQGVVQKPVSCFVSWDNYWFLDLLVKLYGFVLRVGARDELIERMIRSVLQRNAYFAIWPEGSLCKNGLVGEGFSGIIRAYCALNSQKNVIPFVPVLFRGSDCYHHRRNPKFLPKMTPIEVHFLKPFYLPRSWLKHPDEGGKTPREMIDHIMTILARANGQNAPAINHRLEYVRNRKKEEQSG